MSTDAISVEKTEEANKTDNAFIAGADLEEIANLRSLAEMEEFAEVRPMESSYDAIDMRWSDEAASEKAAYTAMITNTLEDGAVYDQIKHDLVTTGTSENILGVESKIAEDNVKTAIQAAGTITSDPTVPDELKTTVALQLQEEIVNPSAISVADEAILNLTDSAEALAETDNDIAVTQANSLKMSERLQYLNQLQGIAVEMADDAFQLTPKTVIDVLGSFVTVNDSVSYSEFLDFLGEEWSSVDFVLPGEMLKTAQKYMSGKSLKEKAEFSRDLHLFLKENAGVLDSNAVQALNMWSTVFNEAVGTDPDSWWERVEGDRWLMDVGNILDLVSVGGYSTLKNGVNAALKYSSISRMRKVTAANPEAAKEVAESVMKSEKAAEMAGTSKAETVIKTTVPKVEGWKDAHTTSGVTKTVNRTEEDLDALAVGKEVEDYITQGRGFKEIKRSQEDLLNSAKGNNLWIADTELSGEVGKKWKASALIGKTENFGFASKDEALSVLNDIYKGQGKLLTRTSRLDSVEEVVEKGKELKSAIKEVVAELESTKASKLPRGEEKALRRRKAQLESEINAAKKLSAPKRTDASGTKKSRAKQQEAALRIEREINPKQIELQEIDGLLAVSTEVAKAEANISRLKAGQLDKLDDSVRLRLDAITTDKVVQAAKPAEDNVEYFVKADAQADISFKDDDVAVSFLGEKGSWLADADTAFSKQIAQAGNAIFDKWKFLEKDLLSHLDPFAKLSREEQIKLSKALETGNSKEEVYDSNTLRNTFKITSEKSQEAYRSYRRGMDVAFTLENKMLRETLVSENMVSVSNSASNFTDFAKPLSKEQASGVKFVYDPKEKSVVPVDVADLYKNGESVAKLRSSKFVEAGDVGSSYVIVGRGTTINELPEIVLNYNKGWLPRINQSNYFIVEKRTVSIDGVKTDRTRTVNVAHDLTSATDAIDALNKEAKVQEGKALVEYTWKHDRKITSADKSFEEHMYDLHTSTGGLFYNKRGDRLKDVRGVNSIVTDPLASGVNAMTRVSRDVTMKPFIDDMKARFVATYGDISYPKGVFPSSADNIRVEGQVGDPKVTKARRMFKHIETLEGLSTKAGFHKTAIVAADYAERNLGSIGRLMATGIRSVGDTDPVGWVRAKNFELNLATNPLAQLVVQPSQTLNMFGLAPSTFVQDWRYGRAISKLAANLDDIKKSDAELASIAKLYGVDVDEFKKDITGFRRSGMGAAVTSHEIARDAAKPLSSALSDSSLTRMASAATAPYTKTTQFLGKAFARGEEINIGVHWAVAKRRWMKKNPEGDVHSSSAQFDIAGEARSLSGSMTQPGDFAYQKGIASIPFQYFAIQHKQMLLMLTNRALTGKERFRIFAGQMALWGPAGVGLAAIVDGAAADRELNLSDGALSVINDGIMEAGINATLETVFDQEADLDLSGRFAPAGGVNDNIATAIAEMMLTGESSDIYKIIFGPTAGNFNRFADAGKTVATIFNTTEKTYEDLDVGSDVLLSMFSAWNNFTKARLYKTEGYWLDSKGTPIFQPTDLQLWAKGSLGIQPKFLDGYYRTHKNTRDFDAEINEVAEDYYKHLNRLASSSLAQSSGLGPEGMDKVHAAFDQMLRIQNGILLAHEEDAPLITKALQKKIETNINKVGVDELTDNLIKFLVRSGDNSDARSIVQRAVNLGVLPQEQLDSVTEFVDDLLEGEQ